MLLSEAHNLYIRDKQILGYSNHTLKAYDLQNKLLIKYLGDININEVNIIKLKEYLYAQKHLKPASLGHRVRYLKSFFR